MATVSEMVVRGNVRQIMDAKSRKDISDIKGSINMIVPAQWEQGAISYTTGNPYWAANAVRTDYVSIPEMEKVYQIINPYARNIRIYQYDANKTFIGENTTFDENAICSVCTLTSSTAYVRVVLVGTGTVDTSFADGFALIGGFSTLLASHDKFNLKTVETYYTDSNITGTIYADCDTLPAMQTLLFSNVSTLLHPPVLGYFTGYITTINYHGYLPGGATNRDFSVQIAQACGDGQNEMYIRARYGSWTGWKNVRDPKVILNAYRGLKNFTVLGDSISVSLSYPTMSPSYVVKSWATIMADSMNATAQIYAQGGRTTADMLASDDYQTAVANANNNQFAIIALGINDANAAVSSSTFKTNYTQLINDMLSHHKFVLCCTIPAGLKNTDRTQYNEDIKTVVGSISGAFVVDVDAYSDEISPLCHLGHMSSTGYAALASFIEKAIDDVLSTYNYFLQGVIDQ